MTPVRPWYREPWPWILMAAPAAAILAGAATAWIAVASADGLVADDYYRQGLAINRTLAREARARQLGISGQVELRPGKIEILLQGNSPDSVFVHLAHATRAGHDLRLQLPRSAPGVYRMNLPPLPAGRWHVVVEDPRREWRLELEAG